MNEYYFELPYTETGYAKVTVVANSMEEALELIADGDVEQVIDTDCAEIEFNIDFAELISCERVCYENN